MESKPQEVVKPPLMPKKQTQKPLSGYIIIVRVNNDSITLIPKMPEKPSSNFYILKLDKLYRINLDNKIVETRNPRKIVKPYNQRIPEKKGFFSFLSKKKYLQTSLNTLFVREQYHNELPEIIFISFHKNLIDAKSKKKEPEVDIEYIEARTSNNKRALMKGSGKLGFMKNKLSILGKRAESLRRKINNNRKKAQEWAKENVQKGLKNLKGLEPYEIQALYNQLPQLGGMPDFKKDAKNMVKWTMNLPERGYKSIQNKAQELYKEIKGGDWKKAEKCCKELEKLCKEKCKKNQQKGGNCLCPGRQCVGSKCGGGFDIHSKENQEFGKALNKRYNQKANKLKAEIKEIQKFKTQLKKLPAKEFNNNLKSKKHMSNSDKKKHMIARQDKKIATRKQKIKDHEEEVYGMFR